MKYLLMSVAGLALAACVNPHIECPQFVDNKWIEGECVGPIHSGVLDRSDRPNLTPDNPSDNPEPPVDDDDGDNGGSSDTNGDDSDDGGPTYPWPDKPKDDNGHGNDPGKFDPSNPGKKPN